MTEQIEGWTCAVGQDGSRVVHDSRGRGFTLRADGSLGYIGGVEAPPAVARWLVSWLLEVAAADIGADVAWVEEMARREGEHGGFPGVTGGVAQARRNRE